MQMWRMGMWIRAEEGGGMNLESSVDSHSLVCVKQTARGKALCTTGSSARCSVMGGLRG